jgi:hypothetical protein
MIDDALLTPTSTHCPTKDMIADFLTKPMTGKKFKKQVRRAMINE